MKSRISTSDPSFKRQWVTSPCQHSLGSAASKRMSEEAGRFLGSGSMNPAAKSTLQMVETDGQSARSLERCQWMVRAPPSKPASTRSLRSRTISSSRSTGVRLGRVWGRRERGPMAS